MPQDTNPTFRFEARIHRDINCSGKDFCHTKTNDCPECEYEQFDKQKRAAEYKAACENMAERYFNEIALLAAEFGFKPGDNEEFGDTGDVYDDVDDMVLYKLDPEYTKNLDAQHGVAFLTGTPLPDPNWSRATKLDPDYNIEALKDLEEESRRQGFSLFGLPPDLVNPTWKPAGVLTREMIEDAAIHMVKNFGRPEPRYALPPWATPEMKKAAETMVGKENVIVVDSMTSFADPAFNQNLCGESGALPNIMAHNRAQLPDIDTDPPRDLRVKGDQDKPHTWVVLKNATAPEPEACECGAHKANGAQRGSPAHSSWCPWRK